MATPAEMMTFAALAYASPALIRRHLSANPVGTETWEVLWVADAVEEPLNFAFIAQAATDGRCVVAIRGTYPNPFSSAYWDDARQDSPYGDMQVWPYGGDGRAKVSKGTWEAFGSLLTSAAKADAPGAGTLEAAISSLSSPSLTFTGHSLGGTLAPVLALWAKTTRPDLDVGAYAFAGMTPGESNFAALFGDGTALDGKVFRYNNTLDTVPYGWDRVREAAHFYQPSPSGGPVVAGLIDLNALLLAPYDFAPVAPEVKLEGKLLPYRTGCEFVDYVVQNLGQHLPSTYLDLLGAPSLPLTMGLAVVVRESPAESVAALDPTRLPTIRI